MQVNKEKMTKEIRTKFLSTPHRKNQVNEKGAFVDRPGGKPKLRHGNLKKEQVYTVMRAVTPDTP
jgi:hypothetical protein